MRTSKATGVLLLFLTGLLPVFAGTASYLINIHQTDVPSCIPLWSGCISVSRAARSGPGLLLFKTLMLPAAVMLAVSWVYIGNWARHYKLATEKMFRVLVWLGLTGSASLALYVINLGLDGTMYWFMRRFGVSIFFGIGAICQLLLARMLWPARSSLPFTARKPVFWFVFVVSLEWLIGVAVAGKRLVVSDAGLLDKVENIAEWWFALLFLSAFMLLAWLLASTHSADD